ncbi:UDP-N-acetylglucosamine--dolichyl-phosphate N-acetylglucosaminephosphotransferase [Quillaja saponaria]|uniref:UDP-N-acetylglucosamine--dolichyl-phosphate N-acetylglucosaminephosphotransferase n=1 Tax=Quillaja saponaria TaxID=32244 RepID=A0AAD7Q889_QUISA|nr:UDP-N-acetylglucosamine--dolichyl-phosphate N-acetylglucosaminephosphotransferase [Quillaja saponaria]
MAARNRGRKLASTDTVNDTHVKENTQRKPQEPNSTDAPIAPPKSGFILKLSFFFSIPYFYLLFYHYKIEQELKRSILINAVLSLAGFFVTLKLIPVASRYVLRRNLFGYDINKKGTSQGTVKVPESLGIVIGIVFLVLAIIFQYFNFTADSNWLVEYNAALASICFMTLLGFVDDVLDVPWRVKLVLPSIAALPLLMAYAGHTTIIIPKPLVPYVGIEILDLGCIYKLYMGLLAVFCTNSINIHAGINGLEVGQTVVVASAILIHNIMQIGASTDAEYKQAHAFSVYLVQPLLATSLALLSFNWYPSSVFVGDTYTYFAGMTMAVVGILGHFSETLLIFFLPQVLNFLLSLPQLAGFVPCPRHRLPRFDPQTGLLTGTDDGTLVNFFLRQLGRKSEKSLCIYLLVFQATACCFCFVLRYFLAGWYK